LKRSLSIALVAAAALVASTTWLGSAATACEKHLQGHQSNSDTNAEGIRK
jgi:hypothetical protein